VGTLLVAQLVEALRYKPEYRRFDSQWLSLEFHRHNPSWIGHILRRNCLLKQVIEGKIKEEMEVTRRRGRRRKKVLDDLNL
jgi:hypothetical protein